jgi:hypothetical protein
MKLNLTWITIMVLFLLSFCVGNQSDKLFSLQEMQKRNRTISVLAPGNGFDGEILKVTPTGSQRNLVIWQEGDGGDWLNAKYLVCEIWHDSDFAGIATLNFFRKADSQAQIVAQGGDMDGRETERPRISAKIGVLPLLKTKVIFPLSHLDAQNIFMQRFPRQLKGTVLGNRMVADEISRVEINFGPLQSPSFMPVFEIASVTLHGELPEPYPTEEVPLTDQFGQWARKDWPGKTKSTEELDARLKEQLAEAETANFPDEWSQYGGWNNKFFGASGYFRTHHDGQRWWLVDPDGFAFVSVGIDCIRPESTGTSSGQEDLFEWLPDENDPLYKQVYSKRGEMTMVDFYKINFIKVFGEQWREMWDKITAGQIRKFSINTIANWSDNAFMRSAKIPYVLPMAGFPSTKVMLFRDFPDVFSDEYRQNSVRFASQLESYKNDKHLIGYFLRNEPHWAFGAHDIAFEMFGTNQASASKDSFVVWISKRYDNNTGSFNRQWNLQLNGFSDLKTESFRDYPSDASKADFQSFSEKLVARYVNVPCDEVEKIAPNHLNLGMRYAWMSSDLLYKAGERFDVFSINGYGNPGPPETAEIARISGKPVMIGEFHFGSVDRGLPATGIQGAVSQAKRGTAYRYYVEQGFARPEMVGIHYFQWLDQPIFGRFDGENYNIGLFDICNKPYEELIDAAVTTHRKIYKIATGEEKPFETVIEKIPAIYY